MNTQPMNSLNDFTDLTPEMKSFITDMLNIARNQFLESQELAPMLFVLRDDKQLGAIPLAGMPKHAATRFINTLRSVAPVIFMCEAWTTRCTANPNARLASGIIQ